MLILNCIYLVFFLLAAVIFTLEFLLDLGLLCFLVATSQRRLRPPDIERFFFLSVNRITCATNIFGIIVKISELC